MFVSAQYGYGMNELFVKLRRALPAACTHLRLRLPFTRSYLMSKLYQHGDVIRAEYGEDALLVEAYVPDFLLAEARRYRIKERAS